ncbi:Cation/H+ exchanger [Arabidopsis thaliana x Arabidopsis arenosa]|uniref:Cation/H+ exchanger n=1 Tax=Arabidopsis thaliana x Arabidopsis arenosa TaxID=1240361 RepID=A0A8T1ZR93_9BRAS|nr:Cation/H+ exchanger [Arabidopsis thaliana x Arabidopsis arenosa]
MPFNITSVKTSSNGVWQGDNPLNFAFPLLIVQTALIIAVSRSLAVLFKPLRQPKVIAEIVGGILLGPSALGRNTAYMDRIFPKWSMPILESVASIGLLFFLFLVGLELDLSSIRRSGKRAFGIAVAGITLPFIAGVGVAFVIRNTLYTAADRPGYAEFLVFMGVALSITAFPVLARILAELKLLTTQIGETAMAAAAFNDVAAWILLALAVALAGDGGEGGGEKKSPLVSLWVLLSGAGFVVFMLVVIRPGMKWVAKRGSPENDVVRESYVCLTLAGVMVSGFATDLIGIHSIFGAFVFGLTIPKDGEFGQRLIERIEDFVSGLLLPLYFATSGLKTDVAKIRGAESWGMLGLVVVTACAGKIVGTFVVAVMVKVPAREALTLGFLMNTKGLVELIVLNIGKEKKVLNDETFAILVLMALFTTFITTPTVMAIYKPARGTHRKLKDLSASDGSTKEELRILACLHGPANVSSLISLVESIRTTKILQLKLFVMHLMELTERSSSIIMVQRARKNGLPFVHRYRHGERHSSVIGGFEAYRQLGRVAVRPITAVSPLPTMHEDICHMAETKRVTMIILPFHKRWNVDHGHGHHHHQDGGDGNLPENVGHGWRLVNQRVLKNAPCSVAVLVDRGLGSIEAQTSSLDGSNVVERVCVIFFGGPDDREALELGGRMAEHPAVKVTVIRFLVRETLRSNAVTLRPATSKGKEKNYAFLTTNVDPEKEKELDEGALEDFKSKWKEMVEYKEKESNNIIEEILSIGQSKDFDLIVVGRGRLPSAEVAALAERQAEHPELGPIGDVLASSINHVIPSILVVQQHNKAHVEDITVSKIISESSLSINGDTNV